MMKKAYSSSVWHMAESIWESVIHNNIGAKHWDQLSENDAERAIVSKYLVLAEETLKKVKSIHEQK